MSSFSLEAIAALTEDASERKRCPQAVPYLTSFIASGEPAIEVDMTIFEGFTPKQMVANFNTHRKATHHNYETDQPEYNIPGAFHVVPKVTKNGKFYLINQRVVDALMAAETNRIKNK